MAASMAAWMAGSRVPTVARIWVAMAAAAALVGCGTTRSVRPVGEGKHEVDVALAGPLMVLGPPFPTPMVYAGYRYGLNAKTDLFGRLNLLTATMGIGSLEAGAGRLLLDQDGAIPALSGSASVLGLVTRGGANAIPQVAAQASWLFADQHLLFAGLALGASYGERLDQSPFQLHFSPVVGLHERLFGSAWTLDVELRWLAPTRRTDVLTVNWIGVGPWGALAPGLGVSRSFGGDR